MKISEVITELEDAKKEVGDVEGTITANKSDVYTDSREEVSDISIDSDHDGYYILIS